MSPRSPGTPRLSVITPLFNCLEITRAMVESLRASIPASISYEVILVDDGSTDGTRDWLAGLGAPFRVILNDTNLGFGAATNRGAAAARGEVLALLNNDLLFRRGWLRPMMRSLRTLGRHAGLVGNVQLNAGTLEVDHVGIVVNQKCKPEHDRSTPSWMETAFHPTRRVFAVTGACVLVRKETWARLGGFDEGYVNGCEDIDLSLRASELGLANAVALRSRVLHRVSSSPGRKRRDEENSQRLVLRWRHRLALFSAREWTWGHFLGILPEPRDFAEPSEAWGTVFYLLRLRRRPPDEAMAAMNAAIDGELARWQKIFSK
ncbi:MAG TPA: glycosyltransferase [Opitutaceae bacterium]